MVLAVTRSPVTAEALVLPKSSPCGICGRRSDSGTSVGLRVLLLYTVSIIPRCYVISAIDSVANDDTPKKEYEGIRFILGQQRTNSPHITAVTTVALSGTIQSFLPYNWVFRASLPQSGALLVLPFPVSRLVITTMCQQPQDCHRALGL